MGFSYYMCDLLTRHFFTGETIPSPFATKNPYLGLINSHPAADVDYWFEVTAPEYARQRMYPVVHDRGYVYTTATITFPTATSDWGNVLGVVVFDESATSTGNTIYDVPWNNTSLQQVPYYNITSGQTLSLTSLNFVAGVRAMGPYSNENGGISVEFSKVIINWMFNTAVYPYSSRTYDIALGRNANYDPGEWARFTGDWTECSGKDYKRVPMATTDWEGVYLPIHVENKNEIVFTVGAEEDWGLITDVILYVRNTNTPAFWGHLATPTTVYQGEGFAIGANELKIYWGGDSIY